MISNNKRDNEKKKEQKKKDKQLRKEARKGNATSSFDDMIAYVDANGNLTDTPPTIGLKEEIDPTSIAISTPKMQEIAQEPLSATVDFFAPNRGYGFLRDTASGERVFFHISNAPDDITEGMHVSYEIGQGERGPAALNIHPLA